MTRQEILQEIMGLPLVKKYYDEYNPVRIWACVEPVEFNIYLIQEARKNYFIKTIKQIEKIAGVDSVIYEKAQDETVSDCLRIWLKNGFLNE
jgi:ATP sulfurylase